MKKIVSHLLCATALVAVASPALATRANRATVAQLSEKISIARSEPGVAQTGTVELDRAQAELKPLLKALDRRKTRIASDMTGEINALIDTARVQARIASAKTELAALQSAQTADLANAKVAEADALQSARTMETQAVTATAVAASAQAQLADARRELQAYKMTQSTLGATLVLRDVAFQTGRSDMTLGAIEQLKPLASYLRANPDVRVQIDGHTDSQGGMAANQLLSEQRAQSVGRALTGMGLDSLRFQEFGHGETQPLNENVTMAGRQQNRRVDVTLVGQQASAFTF